MSGFVGKHRKLLSLTAAVLLAAAAAVVVFWLQSRFNIFTAGSVEKLSTAALILGAVVLALLAFALILALLSLAGAIEQTPKKLMIVCAALCFACCAALSLLPESRSVHVLPESPSVYDIPASTRQNLTADLVLLDYLKGKNVVASEYCKTDFVQRIEARYVREDKFSMGDQPELTDAQKRYLLSFEYFPVDATDYRIFCSFADGWQTDKDIVCVPCADGDMFIIPLMTYYECLIPDDVSAADEYIVTYDTVGDYKYAAAPQSVIQRESLRTDVDYVLRQTLILFAVMLLGVLFTYSFAGGCFSWLCAVLAFPSGLAAVVAGAFILSVSPFGLTQASAAILYVLLCAVFLYVIVLKKRIPLKAFLPSAVVAAVFILLCVVFCAVKNYFLSWDSVYSVFLGRRLADVGTSSALMDIYIAYGSFTYILVAIGELFGCGLPYAVYPLIFVNSAALIGAFCYALGRSGECKGTDRKTAVLSVFGAVILLCCGEFIYYHSMLPLNNMAVGMYVLICAGSLYMLKKQGNRLFEVLCVLASVIAMLARLEGAVYAAFILACSIPLGVEPKIRQRIFWSAAIAAAAYQGYLYLTVDPARYGVFWSAGKGVLAAGAVAAVLLLGIHYNAAVKKLPQLDRHSSLLFFAAIVLVLAACVYLKRNGGILETNIVIFPNHFLKPAVLGAWLFTAVMSALMISRADAENKTALLLIFGYIVMTFCIFLFRSYGDTLYPIRDSAYDSCRRVLAQLIPAALMLSSMGAARALSRTGLQTAAAKR